MPGVPQMKREYIELYDFLEDKKISEAIAEMHKILLEKGDSVINVSGDEVSITVMINRLETQDEADARDETEARNRRWREEQERRQYEALKAKFEPAIKV